MFQSPLFSVLIANYNNGRYLRDAVESVYRQTYPNWEIILVDDGSTDKSVELYKELEKDSRIHIFYNEGNHGCGCTKHRCIEQAHGELCGFLDSDDALEPEALQVMVNEHIIHKNAGMIFSKQYFCDNNLKPEWVCETCPIPTGGLLENTGAISHFVTFKKSFYGRTKGINPFFKRAVDHDLYFLLEEVGEVLPVDKPLYRYRYNTGNNICTGNNDNIYSAYFWDLLVMTDTCKRRGLDIESTVTKKFIEFINGEKKDSYIAGQDHVRNSKSYKIGKSLRNITKALRIKC